MIHTNYQPARKGLFNARILAAKQLRVIANSGTDQADALLTFTKAEFQRKRLRYSDRGDFTRCYRGGF